MTRYARDIKWKFLGDVPLAMRYIPQARGVVGQVLDVLGTVPTKTLSRDVAPGVSVRVDGWGSQLVVTIRAGHLPGSPEYVPPTDFFTWVPKGFVFYPASDDSPNGWGLPINYVENRDFDEDSQVFSPENLAPGLDVERWTPGGALGEVLVTRMPDAGYPPRSTDTRQVITGPPLYHPEHGPHPTRKGAYQPQDWKAYRLEFVDFDANSPGITTEDRAQRKAWKREMFRLFNEHRQSIGRDPVSPPIRGDYDSAQATCEWALSTMWYGHSCVGYPATWKTMYDRGFKNGALSSNHIQVLDATMDTDLPNGGNPASESLEIIMATSTSFDLQYYDETGFEVYIAPEFISFTPDEALNGWLNSPKHKTIIEHTRFDQSPYWHSWMHIGDGDGVAATHFCIQGQWIHCGNTYWHSAHSEIPTLSWFGFTSKNLYDDTWPVAFSMGPAGGGALETVISVNDDVISTPDAEGRASTLWYQRLHGASGFANEAITQGTLGSCIFARGRAIAVAPDSGYVLAAGMYKHGDHNLQYRLVAICLHKSDDPGDVWQGFTPKVRIWWVDLPPHVLETFNGVPTSWIAGNPHTVIHTKYGSEPTVWPWVEANSPYSWRGGDAVDVSSSNLGRDPGDLLSYASMWEFNPEGTKAICLRYSYNLAFFDAQANDATVISWANHGMSFSTAFPAISDLGKAFSVSTVFDSFTRVCGTPVFCELDLDHQANSIATSLRCWTHNPAGGFLADSPPLDLGDRGDFIKANHWYITECYNGYHAFTWNALGATIGPHDPDYWRAWARCTPIYAFYSATGDVKAVYDIETNMNGVFREKWTMPGGSPELGNISQTRAATGAGIINGAVFYRGVAVGPSVVGDADCAAMVANATQYSSEIGCNGINTMADHPIILHASDDHVVFVALGVDCPAILDDPRAPPGYPFMFNPVSGPGGPLSPDKLNCEINPLWRPWDVVETDRPVVQMDVYMDGARIHSSRHPNPNKFHLHRAWCSPWILADRRVYYIDNDIPFSFAPRWNAAWGITGGFVADRDGNWALCATYGVQRGTSFFRTDDSMKHTDQFGEQYTFVYPGGASVYNTSGPYNVGGFMVSSFASQEELAEMMHIPGANPRSHYVRIV